MKALSRGTTQPKERASPKNSGFFFSTTGSFTLTELVHYVSLEKGINPDFRQKDGDGLLHPTAQTATLSISIKLNQLATKIEATVSYTEHFFQWGKGHDGTVDVLVESREEEPVWQWCNVATDNRNWNDTSHTTSLFQFNPDKMLHVFR